MNPVYSTLNQLTQSNAFRRSRTSPEQFLPTISTIPASVSRCRSSTRRSGTTKDPARSLRRTTGRTYRVQTRVGERHPQRLLHNFLRADRRFHLHQRGKLLRDNRRLTETLVGNGLALRSNLLKIDAEIAKNEAARVEAEKTAPTRCVTSTSCSTVRSIRQWIAADSTALTAQPPSNSTAAVAKNSRNSKVAFVRTNTSCA